MNGKWLAILLMMASCGAFADTFGVKIGLQQWQSDSTGYVGEADDAVLNWNSDPQSQLRLYGSIEHPMFLFPNVKLGYSKFDFDDIALLDQTYRLGGQLYSIASELNYGGEYEIVDFISYYEIIDRDILSFDLGVNFRFQDTEYQVTDVNSGVNSQANVSSIEPLFYAKLTSSLPLMGLYSYFEYQAGDKNHDYETAIGYQFSENMMAAITVYIGYKDQQISYQYNDGIVAKAEWDSVFVSLESNF